MLQYFDLEPLLELEGTAWICKHLLILRVHKAIVINLLVFVDIVKSKELPLLKGELLLDVGLDKLILGFKIEIVILLVVSKVKEPWLELIVVVMLRDERCELVDRLHVLAEILSGRVMLELSYILVKL